MADEWIISLQRELVEARAAGDTAWMREVLVALRGVREFRAGSVPVTDDPGRGDPR